MNKSKHSFSEITDNTKKNDLSLLPSMSISGIEKKGISKNKNFRGVVGDKNNYYIINELISGENSRVFSAVKRDEKGGGFEDKKYCIKYYSKHWIKFDVLTKLKIPENQIIKFFESLKNSFTDHKSISHKNIQDLVDYFDDEDGMYIVTEFCEWTLKDFITITREPLRFSKIPFECKIRKVIQEILTAVQYLHDKYSLSFGGMLNSSDIMIQENLEPVVKLPHPFLNNLLTIVKIYSTESFPSYYSPEVYTLFRQDELAKLVQKKDDFDSGNILQKLTHNFDMWALGYLLYEIVFENPPFIFDDLGKALKTLTIDYSYKINPYAISYNLLKIINMCLQHDPNARLQSFLLQELMDELKKENESGEDFDNALKDRSSGKVFNTKDDFEVFTINNANLYEKYQ